MQEEVSIEGARYKLVPRQRAEADSFMRVYKGDGTFLRTGPRSIVERALEQHAALARAGFPVAKIIQRGELLDLPYFIEESFGEKNFRTLFTEDFERSGAVSDERFSEFLAVTEIFARAQIGTIQSSRDILSFRTGIHLDTLAGELLEYGEKIQTHFDKAMEATASFPFVLSHGDLGPSNMFPRGVIDIEDTFFAPLGFDLISALITIEWFPERPGYESTSKFIFSEEQKALFVQTCESVVRSAGYPSLIEVRGEFEFFRAVWLSARMHRWPKIQRWRYDRFIKKYFSK